MRPCPLGRGNGRSNGRGNRPAWRKRRERQPVTPPPPPLPRPAPQPGPDQPPPPPRRGPRPLVLHLTLEMLRLASSAAVLPSLSSASATWSAQGRGAASAAASPAASAAARARKAAMAALAARLKAVGASPAELAQAVAREALDGHRALLAGINAYRRHPYRRDLPDPPALWAEGGSRLLDFAPAPAAGARKRRGRGAGSPVAAPVVLFVPSLVNRATVLDLAAGNSLMRWLAAEGLRPLLLDWGWPGAIERDFTLTDYIAGRLERALAEASRLAEGPLPVVGYCMGGNLALAAALRRPDLVGSLALLATPWDFHAGDAAGARALARLLPALDPVIEATGTLPVDVLQAFFAALDPFAIAAKYRAFARMDPASERARAFVALEDWLNDGVPLAGPVARETLGGWYGRNSPARLGWRIAGAAVDPRRVAAPSLV
ncbi:MAG: alpha/beta fold hydrolase, partial [Alphaproteobacteria bacterium]|nr:alpha/beta fold hydrolase [Alphaproteobacteria bacterium]